MEPLPLIPPPDDSIEKKQKKKKKKKKKVDGEDAPSSYSESNTSIEKKKKKKKKKAKETGEIPMVEATPVEEKPKSKRVKVMAPATLPGGATFVAEVDGVQFTARVPKGGVQEGEVFKTKMDESTVIVADSAPRGRWRADLFGCCDSGYSDCCSLCCMAFNFPCIITAQVIQRLNLTLGGCQRGGNGDAAPKKGMSPCVLYPSVTAVLFLFSLIFMLVGVRTFNRGLVIFSFALYVFFAAWVTFTVFVAMICARKSMRELYQIPGSCCGDFCVTYWCSCCVAIQMARQTHDPNKHPYNCCTITGLSADAPKCDVV